MKIFLTGGTGYLGSQLTAALLEAGHELTILCRTPPETAPGAENPALQWVAGDLRNGPPDTTLLSQHRVVLHAAAMVKSWARDRSEFDQVNVDAYESILEASARAGVSKVVHTSSFLSLGPSPSPVPITEGDRQTRDRFYTDYERTKYLADEVTERWAKRGVPIISLYPTVLFGPGARTDGNLVGKMVYWVAQGKFPGMIGSGDQVWNYAYVPDVVQGHLAALEHGLVGERYLLGGENVKLRTVLEKIHARLGKAFRVRRIPIGVAEALGSMMELGARVTGKAPDLTRGVAGVYREHWSYSSEKAMRSLRYEVTPFDQALEETVTWAAGLTAW